MCRLGVHIDEIPKVVMRTLTLRYFVMWLRLDRVNNIGELDSILDEEDGDVVPDNIPVALGRVHLDGEPAHITDGVGTTLATLDSREAQEERCLAAGIGQHTGGRDVLGALEELEGAESACAASMHDAFGDAFVVEAHNLNME